MVCALATALLVLAAAAPAASFSPARSLQQLLPPFLRPSDPSWGDAAAPEPADGDDAWNVLYHLGGNGPWVENKLGTRVAGGIAVPEGCRVDQVHMMSRHGERYPISNAGSRMLEFMARVKNSSHHFEGSLAFLNDWTYITDKPDEHFQQLTTTGPYAGVLEAFTTGVKLRTRYAHLVPNGSAPTHLWASDSARVEATARHFAAGFFGLASAAAAVVVIPESAARGGDTLTPGHTCLRYRADAERGRDRGYRMRDAFAGTYLPGVAARLGGESGGFALSGVDVWALQETCGFETTVRGRSPWCGVFSRAEWAAYEYARDVIHYYRSGAGTPYARAMGALWLNATASLLRQGPAAAGPLFFSFVHDGDIVPMLAALGLFEEAEDLPVDRIVERRRWRTSQIVPMGGRVILERMTCGGSGAEEAFVRFNVNDGIMPLPGCSDGPGGSCPLAQFAEYVRQRGEAAGDFREVCGLAADAAPAITFLKQPGFGSEEA